MADDHEYDERFASDVGTALRGRAADLTPSPALLPDLRKRYGRRVAVGRAGLVAAPLAVAAVVAAVVAPGSAPSGSSPQAQSTQTRPRETGAEVRTIGYVAEQVGKALDDADRHVVRSTQTRTLDGRQVVTRYWLAADYSKVRVQTTIDGVVDRDTTRGRTESVDVVHASRTWYVGPGFGDGVAAGPFPSPAKIKAALAAGGLEVVGAEVIDGQSTIHLRTAAGEADFTDLWVAESTYLPLRVDDRDYTWLPPTPENLALLTPTVPAGFTQVAPGNGDGEVKPTS